MDYIDALAQLTSNVTNNEKSLFETCLTNQVYIRVIKNYSIWSPALLAALFGLTDTLQVLINCRKDVIQEKTDRGSTPAMLAAYFGHPSTLQVCIDTDKSVLQQKNHKGDTPAIAAAFSDHQSTLQVCIDADKSVLLQKNSHGNTPATIAARYGRTTDLQACIDADKSVLQQKDSQGITPAIFAAYFGDASALLACINADKSVLQHRLNGDTTPAIIAAHNGHTDALQTCINADKDVLLQKSNQGNTPALSAALNGHTAALQACIDADKDVLLQKSNQGNTPALLAAGYGHAAALKTCIDADKSILQQKDSRGWTPAIITAYCGHASALQACIDGDKSVLQQKDSVRCTPAIITAYCGHASAMQACIKAQPQLTYTQLATASAQRFPQKNSMQVWTYLLILSLKSNKIADTANTLKNILEDERFLNLEDQLSTDIWNNILFKQLCFAITQPKKSNDLCSFQLNDNQLIELIKQLLNIPINNNHPQHVQLIRNMGQDLTVRANNTDDEHVKCQWLEYALLFLNATMHDDDKELIHQQLSELSSLPPYCNANQAEQSETCSPVTTFCIIDSIALRITNQLGLSENQADQWLLKMREVNRKALFDHHIHLQQKYKKLLIENAQQGSQSPTFFKCEQTREPVQACERDLEKRQKHSLA